MAEEEKTAVKRYLTTNTAGLIQHIYIYIYIFLFWLQNLTLKLCYFWEEVVSTEMRGCRFILG